MIDDVTALRAAVERGETFRYRFFWQPSGAPEGPLDDSCLSQWWLSPFTVDGVAYSTAEQWMMAGKARLFGDDEVLAQILATHDPKAVKKLGRAVRGFDEPTWRAHRDALVTRGNVEKFGQIAALRAYLLGTGDDVLVEASPLDRICGIGLAARDDDALDPRRWQGSNLLGFALMRARAALRAG